MWDGLTTFIHNGKEQGSSASVDTKVSGESMKLSLSKASSVGSHTSTATCSSVTGGRGKCSNYKLSNGTENFTIKAVDGTTDTSKTFKVTFNSNGGTIKGSSSESCTTKTDSCDITGLPTATKEGYTFKDGILIFLAHLVILVK